MVSTRTRVWNLLFTRFRALLEARLPHHVALSGGGEKNSVVRVADDQLSSTRSEVNVAVRCCWANGCPMSLGTAWHDER